MDASGDKNSIDGGSAIVAVSTPSEVPAATSRMETTNSVVNQPLCPPSAAVESTSSPPTSTTHKRNSTQLLDIVRTRHARLPGIRRIPLPAIGIIALIALVNVVVWIVVGIVLYFHGALIPTALLSWSFGLRHALDADHISAIDLMTRRLIASGQRPVTVGTFFSLGHSTIVIVTSIAVAATAAAVSSKFNGFGTVGGIIGTAVSAGFLLVLGLMNAYILYRLVKQMKKVLNLRKGEEEEAWKVDGGGCLFAILKRMFRIVDRPWKMYPLGVLFGLGFDTSSEIALLGISSIQSAKGTSIWLILIFPILFTAGMCLIDTMDGALMLTVYILPTGKFAAVGDGGTAPLMTTEANSECEDEEGKGVSDEAEIANRARDPVAFLYYSIVLTTLTVMVALVIGTIQMLTLVLNVANPTGRFWDGVEVANNYYDVIGGAICGSFVVFGGLSVLFYKPWRKRVQRAKKERDMVLDAGENDSENVADKGLGNRDDLSRAITIVDTQGKRVEKAKRGRDLIPDAGENDPENVVDKGLGKGDDLSCAITIVHTQGS